MPILEQTMISKALRELLLAELMQEIALVLVRIEAAQHFDLLGAVAFG